MEITTEIRGCVLRPWAPADKPSLIVNANNRNVWRNLAGVFRSARAVLAKKRLEAWLAPRAK